MLCDQIIQWTVERCVANILLSVNMHILNHDEQRWMNRRHKQSLWRLENDNKNSVNQRKLTYTIEKKENRKTNCVFFNCVCFYYISFLFQCIKRITNGSTCGSFWGTSSFFCILFSALGDHTNVKVNTISVLFIRIVYFFSPLNTHTDLKFYFFMWQIDLDENRANKLSSYYVKCRKLSSNIGCSSNIFVASS